jgi:hypothetical protein
MPSLALQRWFAERAASLDEMERAHRALRGTGPGVRAAMLRINQAYVMLLSSHFQGFCRDLHEESTDVLVASIMEPQLRLMVQENIAYGRKLNQGNPNAGNIGSDFDRLGLNFWPLVLAHRSPNATRRSALEELAKWRNAIAHQDFAPAMLHSGGQPQLQLGQVQTWRGACDGLARSFDEVMRASIQNRTGTVPWCNGGALMNRRRPKGPPPKFRVGQRVRMKYSYGERLFDILEDRGIILQGGRRVYSIQDIEGRDPFFDFPEEGLEALADNASVPKQS